MIMKKLEFVILAAVMIFALSACASDTASTDSPNPTPSYQGVTFTSEVGASTISVLLPDGWESKNITEGDNWGVPILHGLELSPSVNPDIKVTLACSDGIPGLCGTGKTFEDLDFGEDAGRVIKSTEIHGETQSVRITWEDKPPMYYAEYTIPKTLVDTWEPLILEMLSTAKLAEGSVLREDAIQAVKDAYEGDYESIYVNYFDHECGTWHLLVEYIGVKVRHSQPWIVSGDGKAEIDPALENSYGKPVIYLYPRESTDVTVRLSGVDLICTYPAYNAGWSVTASPDGTLLNHADGQEYSYLFWEGLGTLETDVSEGFCIRGEDTAVFLQETLSALGLTPREYNEFIVWWLPQMQDNPYNLITFAWEDYDASAPLEISPVPDTTLRVFMVWQAADSFVDIPAPILPAAPERVGFTVIEWGGMELK